MAINPALGVMLFVTFLQVPLARLRASLSNLRFMGALLVANFIVIPPWWGWRFRCSRQIR